MQARPLQCCHLAFTCPKTMKGRMLSQIDEAPGSISIGNDLGSNKNWQLMMSQVSYMRGEGDSRVVVEGAQPRPLMIKA